MVACRNLKTRLTNEGDLLSAVIIFRIQCLKAVRTFTNASGFARSVKTDLERPQGDVDISTEMGQRFLQTRISGEAIYHIDWLVQFARSHFMAMLMATSCCIGRNIYTYTKL